MIRREDIRETQRDRAEPSLSFRPGDLVRAKVINIVGSSSGAYTSSCLPAVEECSPTVGSIVAAARTVAGAVQPSPAYAVCGSSSATTTYLLTTAQPELGVVIGFGRPTLSGVTEVLGATSGCPLIPTSWTEMVCPRTLDRFPRKVARVPDELTDILCSSAMEGMDASGWRFCKCEAWNAVLFLNNEWFYCRCGLIKLNKLFLDVEEFELDWLFRWVHPS